MSDRDGSFDKIKVSIVVGSGGSGTSKLTGKLGTIFLFAVVPNTSTSTYSIEFTNADGTGLDGRPDDGTPILTGNRTFEAHIPIEDSNTVTIANASADTYTVTMWLKRGI